MRAAADAQQAIADYFVGLRAINASGEAETQLQLSAAALPDGALAAAEIALRAGVNGQIALAAFRMAAFASGGTAVTRIQLLADQVDMIDSFGNTLPLMSAVIAAEPQDVPIVDNTATPDLRSRRLTHRVLVDDDVEIQFPLGASGGQPFTLGLEMDGSGGHVVTFDPVVWMGEPPVVSDTPGDLTILDCVVWSTSPPKAIARSRGSGGTTIGSNTSFSISPAVDGNTVWDTAVNGPLIVPPGEYLVTPLGEYLAATFTLWGGGAAGRSSTGNHFGWFDSNEGIDSTFDTMVAGGAPGTSTNSGRPGLPGGAASGGDTNTNGNTGGNGTTGSVPGGYGAGAPSGGGNVSGPAPGATPVTGSQPGGGGHGGASGTAPGITSGGGGGSGARCVKAFGEGVLTSGNSYELVVGDGGDGQGNQGHGRGGRATIS